MAIKFEKERRNEKIEAHPNGLVKRSGKTLDTTMTPKKGLTNSPPPVKPASATVPVVTETKEKKGKLVNILRR